MGNLHRCSGRWRLGLALALLVAVLWGLLAIALKIVLAELDPYTVTWFRFTVSFGLQGLWLAGRWPSWKDLAQPPWGLWAVAIGGLATNYILFLVGLQQTSPSNAQVLIQLAPALLGLAGLWVFRERYSLWQWVGVGVLAFGMSLFFHEQLTTLVVDSQRYLWGNLCLVGGAIAWAAYGVAQKQLLRDLPSVSVMWAIYGGCAVLFWPFAQPGTLAQLSPLGWFLLLFCALNTLVAYGGFAAALEHLEASRVSAVVAMPPLITVGVVSVLPYFLPDLPFADPITGLSVVGALGVASGSVLVSGALERRDSIEWNDR
ncbi:MAG: DMT family transporter [Pseudanabaenaceae cyanobacterium]